MESANDVGSTDPVKAEPKNMSALVDVVKPKRKMNAQTAALMMKVKVNTRKKTTETPSSPHTEALVGAFASSANAFASLADHAKGTPTSP